MTLAAEVMVLCSELQEATEHRIETDGWTALSLLMALVVPEECGEAEAIRTAVLEWVRAEMADG